MVDNTQQNTLKDKQLDPSFRDDMQKLSGDVAKLFSFDEAEIRKMNDDSIATVLVTVLHTLQDLTKRVVALEGKKNT